MYIHVAVGKQMTDVKLLGLHSKTFTCVKKRSGSFKNVTNKLFTNPIVIYIYVCVCVREREGGGE